MNTEFNPGTFESKWVQQWDSSQIFEKTYTHKVNSSDKMYLLFAFAYPSGSGLHVGHVESKTALDILARYYRRIGKNVFFPVGWDAFGLPAENYAIKTGVPPVETTKNAINTFRKQIRSIGISYDWKTEIATCHPEYYRWTQWLFLKMYDTGYAYKSKAPVNWCPSCQTVLANEQVVNGSCERCSTDVIQKNLEQWFLKITKYNDELIEGLKIVDWPNATKQMQLNWIGKKEGVNITYPIESINSEVTCFTTRPETNYGASFIVIAPEHLLVSKLMSGEYSNIVDKKIIKDITEYYNKSLKKTEEERKSEGKKKTGSFTGLYATNRLNNTKIPIYVSDFVLAGFGTGAVVGVPAHDLRDFAFAKAFNLPVIQVVSTDGTLNNIIDEKDVLENDGIIVNSELINGLTVEKAKEKITAYLEKNKWGQKIINYNLRDWLVSRQRYWGAPIPIVYDPQGNAHPVKDEHLPWILPTDVDFNPKGGESPLKSSKEFKERVEKLYGKGWTPEYDTLDTFVDSSWYYLRYTDPRNTKEFANKDQMNKWLPVDFYMIGAEHTVLHLLYSRFFTKFLRDLGYLKFDEPFIKMRHQGMILGPDNKKMSKSKGNVINPDTVIKEYGADTLRVYEMFMGPIDVDKPWNDSSVNGVYKFLRKVWNLSQKDIKEKNSTTPKDLEILLNKTIKKVSEDITELKYNTAIAYMMEFVNAWSISNKGLSIIDLERFIHILAPFAPFLCEELYSQLELAQKHASVHLAPWPKYDEKLVQDAVLIIPIQVNGKRRGEIEVAADKINDPIYVIEAAKKKVTSYISTGNVTKEFYVPGRIVNFVV